MSRNYETRTVEELLGAIADALTELVGIEAEILAHWKRRNEIDEDTRAANEHNRAAAEVFRQLVERLVREQGPPEPPHRVTDR